MPNASMNSADRQRRPQSLLLSRPTIYLYNQMRISRSVRRIRVEDRAFVLVGWYVLFVTLLTAMVIYAVS